MDLYFQQNIYMQGGFLKHMLDRKLSTPPPIWSHSVVSSVEVGRADVPKRSVVKIRPVRLFSYTDGSYILSLTSRLCLPPVCAGLASCWTGVSGGSPCCGRSPARAPTWSCGCSPPCWPRPGGTAGSHRRRLQGIERSHLSENLLPPICIILWLGGK